MLKYWSLLLLVLSCGTITEKKPVSEDQSGKAILSITDDEIILQIDTMTQSSSSCLFVSVLNEERYLSYLNRANNEIVVFNIDSRQQLFKIKPEKEGPNGVGTINGFYMKSLDSIFIAPHGKRTIYIIDKDANIINSINYGTSGERPSPNPIIATNLPLVIKGPEIFLPALPFGNWSTYDSYSDVAVCCVIDMETKEYKYLPMTYPEGYLSKGNVEPVYSRVKVGEEFVYSWYADNNIYTTEDHFVIKKHWAGSGFFDEFKYYPKNMDMQGYMRYYSETPAYSSILFDKKRKVYYRIASLGVDVETDDNLSLLARFSPNSSIIILDSLLSKIGETRLPYGRFNINEFFITDEGLYISENSPFNSTYSDEKLHFRLLKLEYNEK